MVETAQLGLLVLAIALSLSRSVQQTVASYFSWIRPAANWRIGSLLIGIGAFVGCLAVAGLVHEPIPSAHDEFSYLLMAETFASGRATNPSPPLPQFFDTFHELLNPVYVSKYFPAQGLFLAIGQKLLGHPAVGLWLSSALACAATFWMLQAWVGQGWALLGAFLMVVHIGILSYWSQSYWGGMAAALGGALFFGAIRRLWHRSEWQNALWLALGLVILVNSRPLEGILAALPILVLFLIRKYRERCWWEHEFLRQFVVPAGFVLLLGAIATGSYNRAITGSALKSPYVLHEEHYQESPPLIFMHLRPQIHYTSLWVKEYYDVYEMRPYTDQRVPRLLVGTIGSKLGIWWKFYCGILLTPALIMPVLLKGRQIRYLQIALLIALIVLSLASYKRTLAPQVIIDLLAFAEIGLLWTVFDDFWSRVALATCSLLIFEMFFTKRFFPHYLAPTACLVLFLEVEGLRRSWNRKRDSGNAQDKTPHASSREAALRSFVLLLPVVCLISLMLRVEARVHGWSEDPRGPERDALSMRGWSLQRADLEKWLEQQSQLQLVFVRYSIKHVINNEWVYNHADLIHSHVIWARDLGTQANQALLQMLPERRVWLLDADRPNPQLVPYAEAGVSNGLSSPALQENFAE